MTLAILPRSCQSFRGGLAVLLSALAVLPLRGWTALYWEVAPATLETEQLLPRWDQSGPGEELQETRGVFGTVGRNKWKWKSPLVPVTCSGHLCLNNELDLVRLWCSCQTCCQSSAGFIDQELILLWTTWMNDANLILIPFIFPV